MSTQRMNPEIKAKWVAALRSGKYTQGRGALRRTNGEMCCLGVLCDILAPDDWAPPPEKGINPDCFRHGGVIDTPSQRLREMAGFPSVKFSQPSESVFATPKVSLGGDSDFLWAFNDAGATFSEIADAIEEQL